MQVGKLTGMGKNPQVDIEGRLNSDLDGRIGPARQAARDGEGPGDAEQDNEREGEEKRRRPGGAEAEAGHGGGGAGAGPIRPSKSEFSRPSMSTCGFLPMPVSLPTCI